MNNRQKDYVLPQAVYFDTNVLRQLSHGVSNVEFIELRDMCDLIRARFFAPEVVVKEWINLRVEEAMDELGALKKASRNLGHLLNRAPIRFDQPSRIEEAINDIMAPYLAEARVEVVLTPDSIRLQTLIDMAVKKEPPFQSRQQREFAEKGFRDTIILFTIMDHLRASKYKNALLLSADKIFADRCVTQRLENAGLSVSLAANLADAKSELKKQIGDMIASDLEERQQAVKSLLVERFDEISNYAIKKARVSEWFLQGWWTKDPLLGSIKGIVSIRPREILNVSLGFTGTKTPAPEGREAITFTVSTEFDVFVYDMNPWPSLMRPKFHLSGAEVSEEAKDGLPLSSLQTRTVTRQVTIEATVLEQDGRYSDLRLERVLTY